MAQPPPHARRAGFGPIMLGYRDRGRIMKPEYHQGTFNLARIVMPALVFERQVVGRWRRCGRHLGITLFESKSAGERDAIAEHAHECFRDDVSAIRWTEEG